MTPSLDIVILSAGTSSRLGQPKQHVKLGGQSLLERALNLACDLTGILPEQRSPFLISGACLLPDCQALSAMTLKRNVAHHYNPDWRQGMTLSIDCARPLTDADGVMILLVDQYRITLDDLIQLHARWTTDPERPAAASYSQTVGPPVVWPRRLWVKTRDGAPSRLDKHALLTADPQLVDLPHASFDLDTNEDLKSALLSLSSSD